MNPFIILEGIGRFLFNGFIKRIYAPFNFCRLRIVMRDTHRIVPVAIVSLFDNFQRQIVWRECSWPMFIYLSPVFELILSRSEWFQSASKVQRSKKDHFQDWRKWYSLKICCLIVFIENMLSMEIFYVIWSNLDSFFKYLF
jgi:hypothetical protein